MLSPLEQTLKQLYLKIVLNQPRFDTLLNFGAVELMLNGKRYPLDITDTTGFQGRELDEIRDDQYILFCQFESDYDEVIEMFREFGDQYAFDLDVDTLNHPELRGEINLEYTDTDLTWAASKQNIANIDSMAIIHNKQADFAIPVAQNADL